ncbi:MAG: hypothetical protein Q9181_007320 [Wetmoreana brouardii]
MAATRASSTGLNTETIFLRFVGAFDYDSRQPRAQNRRNIRISMTPEDRTKVIWSIHKDVASLVPSSETVTAEGLAKPAEDVAVRVAREAALSEEALGNPATVTQDRREAYWVLHADLDAHAAVAFSYADACQELGLDTARPVIPGNTPDNILEAHQVTFVTWAPKVEKHMGGFVLGNDVCGPIRTI